MADNEQDILFKLKTEGETQGAEAVTNALETAGETAKSVEKSSDQALDETRKRLDELSKRTQALKNDTEEFHESQKQVNATLNVGRAAMVGVSAGGAIVAKIFKEIGESINSIDIEHLRQLNSEMAQQVESAKNWAGILEEPISGIQRLLSGESMDEAFGGMNEQLRLNAENAERTAKAIAASRLKAATDNQDQIKSAYELETLELLKQKQELERIIGLRNELAALATERADQEVQSAELRGGDVALAKSNALAAKLQQGLEEIGGKLQQAESDRNTAQSQFNETVEKYNKGVRDGLQKLDPEALNKLALDVDAAQTQLEKSKQAVIDQQQVFETAKTNLLLRTEDELAKLESDQKETVSKGAKGVRDNIYETIKREFSQITEDSSKAVTDTFTKLKESHQKTNESIANNGSELIGIVKSLSDTVSFQARQIEDLKARVAAIPNNY